MSGSTKAIVFGLIKATQIIENIEEIESRVSDATASISILRKQSTAMEAELARQQVGKRLIEALKKLFNLVDDEEGALVQISVIIGVSVSVLKGDFGTLFKDTAEVKAFIARVNALEASLTSCGSSLRKMTESMKVGVSVNISMLDIWDNIMVNVEKLGRGSNLTGQTTTAQNVTISLNWKKTMDSADKAINVLTGAMARRNTWAKNSSLTSFTVANFTTASPRSLKVPQTIAEVNLLKLVGDYGHDE